MGELALVAEKEGIKLLVENEGSCNVATSAELAAFMKLVPAKNVGMNWDSLNGVALKEIPFPDGYNTLPKDRLWNVQAKGKSLVDPQQKLDWAGIFSALERDGYKGQVGLETHYFDGTNLEKSHLSTEEMIRIAELPRT
jgi:sugar phosphate isomerase/epimerase